MDIRWLIAALYPRAVAPHENFPVKEADAPALLGLLADGRHSEFVRYLELLPINAGQSSERQLLVAIQGSLMESSQADALLELRQLRMGGSVGPVASCVAALFECVGLAELDRLPEAVRVLESELERLQAAPPQHAATLALCESVLSQQMALRLAEIGSHADAVRLAKSAMAALPRMDSPIERFEVSLGAKESDRQIHSALVRSLRASSRSLVVAGEGLRGDGWMSLVRAPESRFQAQQRSAIAAAGASLIDELYESQIGWPSGRRRIAFMDPIDSPVGVALLNAELTGSYGSARGHRIELGKVRTLRSEGTPAWRAAEGLRLFRQAGAREALDDLIRLIRAQGPLEPLIVAGRQALERTASGLLPTRSDLAVLSGAADFFGSDELSESFRAAQMYQNRPRSALGEFVYQTSLDEVAWRVMSRVVPGSGCDDDAAQALLSSIRQYPSGALDGQEGAVTSLVRAIDWNSVRPPTRRDWSNWAGEQTDGVPASVARSYVDSCGIESAQPVRRPTGLDLAERLLREAAEVPKPSADELRDATETCIKRMAAIRESAAKGSYGFGGYSAADMACALIEVFKVEALWPHLTDFLTDPRVGRHEKVDALDRLSSGHLDVPGSVRGSLLEASDSDLAGRDSDLLRPSTGPSDESIPAVLRLRGRLGGFSEQERLSSIIQLAGSHDPYKRVDAVRSVDSVLGHPQFRPAAVTLLLQLSYDRDSVVRSEAGRELAGMVGQNDQFEAVIARRLQDLLVADGLLIPLLVLRGLERVAVLPTELRESLDGLTNHPARSVRATALELLNVSS